ncbi:unnamed protein product [Alopecurus aequalis]
MHEHANAPPLPDSTSGHMAVPESINTEEAETAAPDTTREAAEEAFQRAEELYLAGQFARAYRRARRAQRLFPALPGLAHALAAYGIHAAAAANPGRPNWYAVLAVEQEAVPTPATTQDAVKRQFRRLSLLVHPDKNHSAAAEGAFKILREACDALLSDNHHFHPDVNRASAASAAPQPPRRRRSYPPPPQAPAAAHADDDTSRPRTHKRIYCWHCKREFGRQVGPVEERVGAACPWCSRRLWPPWEKEVLLDFSTLHAASG